MKTVVDAAVAMSVWCLGQLGLSVFLFTKTKSWNINLCFGSCFVGVLVGVQKLKRREGIKDCNELCKTVKKRSAGAMGSWFCKK